MPPGFKAGRMPARESVSDMRPKMFEASRLPKFLVTFQLLLLVHVFNTCCRCVDVDECSEGTVNPCPNQCECVHAALCVSVESRYLRASQILSRCRQMATLPFFEFTCYNSSLCPASLQQNAVHVPQHAHKFLTRRRCRCVNQLYPQGEFTCKYCSPLLLRRRRVTFDVQ